MTIKKVKFDSTNIDNTCRSKRRKSDLVLAPTDLWGLGIHMIV